ncbi:MAG: radical SAM protein [Minisyncoccia bacterium]
MKYCIKTYGCQMNKSDSERIASLLESAGHERTSEESDADLVVMNVCSVRQTAIDRIFGNVKKYNKIKKHRLDFKTVITGCVLPKDKGKFENMFDLVINIKEIEKLNRWLHSPEGLWSRNAKCNQGIIQMQKGSTGLKPLWSQQADYFQITPQHQSKITAYVPIMTGCNNFCSYCVVPYTRGREYSRPANEIIEEITKLVKNGHKEIILLGQNVNSYAGKFRNNFKLSNDKYQNNHVAYHLNKDVILDSVYPEFIEGSKDPLNSVC